MTSFNLGTQNLTAKQIIDRTHPPLIQVLPVKAAQGYLEKGLIVAKDTDKIVPFGDLQINLGTGDGTTTEFSGVFPQKPIARGSITITAGDKTLTDDGNGNLIGDGEGTVNYLTGEVKPIFSSAPAADTPITATASNIPIGVLVEDCDTTSEGTARVLRHGTVVKANIYVKDRDLTEDDLAILTEKGVFAV